MKTLLIVFATSVIISSCCHHKKITQQQTHPQDSLAIDNKVTESYLNYEVYYYHTSQATYEEVQIKNGKLAYTTFNAEKNSINTHAVDQIPDRSKENLNTKEAIITKTDIDSLFAKVERLGYWKLDTVIGNPLATESYYTFDLSFKTPSAKKNVLFKSVPGGTGMPDAFRKSRDMLMKLVREKMK